MVFWIVYGIDLYSGTFFGSTRLESLGEINFDDNENDIHCKVKFGKVKGKYSVSFYCFI